MRSFPLLFWMGILSAATLIPLLFSVGGILRYFGLKKHGIRTKAEIIEVQRVHYRGRVSLKFVISYCDEKGKVYTQFPKFGTSSRSKKYAKGSSLPIAYDRNEPENYVIIPSSLYGELAIAFLMAFFLTFFGGSFILELIKFI